MTVRELNDGQPYGKGEVVDNTVFLLGQRLLRLVQPIPSKNYRLVQYRLFGNISS